MALSSSDLDSIKELLQRDPSPTEHHIFDAMWSEHCSYKSSKDILKKYLPITGSEVAVGIGEDSGIVRFTEHDGKQYCIAISHESHNHPSQVLPVEGSATGVGGVVRDVYCMGAEVIGVLNSLHFGIDPTPNSVVSTIEKNVILGVSDYANPLGVPVLGGETVYHESYNDNCLVNVAALGLVEESKIIHSYVPKEAKETPYDIILFGKSTDSTGFGGASFSSGTLDTEAQNIGAVQVHDPFIKRVLVEAIKALMVIVNERQIPIGFKDLGAGGISCAASEIAVGGGFGAKVIVDDVNVWHDGLAPEIIMCSETQERFCLAVPQSFSQEVLDLFNKQFALPQLYPKAGAAIIGHVLQENRFWATYKGETVCDLPVSAITTEVKAHRYGTPRTITRDAIVPEGRLPKEDIFATFLALPNICSKRYVYRHFDNAVRGDTVRYPGESDSVIITPIPGCYAGVTASMDSNLYGNCDPYVSGAYAVAEAVRNVVASGARPLCVTDCLNYGNPEKPSVFFDFEEGVKGIADGANALSFIPGENLPVISGNVSFYNESKSGSAVVPSPVIVVIGKLEDYRKAIPMHLRDAGLNLILIGKRYAEFGATQIQHMYDDLNHVAPQVRFDEEAAANKAIYDAQSHITACHDISMGGAWVTLTDMILGERGKISVGLSLETMTSDDWLPTLFSENGGYIIAVTDSERSAVTTILNTHNVWHQDIGKTTESPNISFTIGTQDYTIPGTDLAEEWGSRNQA
jgi:phosphoribosylformylglycinamidine synthase subunit PurL